jgi:hypothetical protein
MTKNMMPQNAFPTKHALQAALNWIPFGTDGLHMKSWNILEGLGAFPDVRHERKGDAVLQSPKENHLEHFHNPE